MENDSRTTTDRVGERQDVVMELLRTADDLDRYFVAEYAPHRITPQQYNVLRILRGTRTGSLPTMEIAERMVERAPGITRLLDRLEEKGFVERERSSDDRRRVVTGITSKGLELLARLEEPVREHTVAVLDGFEADEVARLKDFLGRIRGQVSTAR